MQSTHSRLLFPKFNTITTLAKSTFSLKRLPEQFAILKSAALEITFSSVSFFLAFCLEFFESRTFKPLESNLHPRSIVYSDWQPFRDNISKST